MPAYQNTSTCAGLQVDTCCQPDPILAAGAKHDVTVANFGNDSYDIVLTVLLLGSGPGASLILQQGTAQAASLSWPGGNFGPKMDGTWSVAVVRQPAGTTRAHGILTTTEYRSEAEADFLNNVPGPVHTCRSKVNVAAP
ncbi:hypothetical protein AB0L70_33690 [Kribbella sp. NPDC051952]|uniref:hypothetical protein n=1 Tax=Kribbella sp. NPDC051952 TaxID=3154851 RepID=UPI00341925DF